MPDVTKPGVQFRDKEGKIKKQAAKFKLFERRDGKWEKLDIKKVESIEVRQQLFVFYF